LKVKRKTLLWITAGLGIALIVYSLIRHFTSFSLEEKTEKYIMDGVILSALGLFMYNRKLVADERKAKEAEEEKQRRIEQQLEEPEEEGEENIPHWERVPSRTQNAPKV
jgi:putative Mn2+ efflux pump MntP